MDFPQLTVAAGLAIAARLLRIFVTPLQPLRAPTEVRPIPAGRIDQ